MGYAIACGHQLTAEAARDALLEGGNALDAAIAAFATSWVVEPCMSGPGGGGFAVIRFEGQNYALDFFTQTPRTKRPADETDFRPIEVDFGGTTEVFHCGYGSIATPGAIDGLYTLHRMGARLPMKRLLEPAIEYAANGHRLVAFQRYDMYLLRDILKSSERGRELFFGSGQLIETGDTVRLPGLADYLDYLAREGRDAFYRGEIARQIAEASSSQGGHLTIDDLAHYHTHVTKGSQFASGQFQVLTQGIPSIGSKILEGILHHAPRTTDSRADYEAAIRHGMSVVHKMKERWFDPDWDIKQGGTSHLNVIDGQGNGVSLSMSLGEGSSCFVKGTDIHLNNMLGEAALLPEGWHSWTPNIRLRSMMTPTIAYSTELGSMIALGSGGASRIPFAIGQVMLRYGHNHRDVEQAIHAPRIHWDGSRWQAEPGYTQPADIQENEWNQWNEFNLYFGGVHTAEWNHGHFRSLGDKRRDGHALYAN